MTMRFEPKTLDYELSPYTGLTRESWIEAAKYLKSDAKIVIAGGGDAGEVEYLKKIIKENKLEKKVILAGFISEEEKIDYYARCLCVYFGAYDED